MIDGEQRQSSVLGPGAGAPLAAGLTTPEIEDIAAERGLLFYVAHTSSPLPEAVGLEIIDIIQRDRLTERAAQLGERFEAGLLALQQRHDCLGDVRARGLLLGLDQVKDRRSKVPDPDLAQRFARQCLEFGLVTRVVRGGLGIFPIAPPITVKPREIDLGLEIFDRAPVKEAQWNILILGLIRPCALIAFERRAYLLYPLAVSGQRVGSVRMTKKLSQAAILVAGVLAMGGCTLNQSTRSAAPVAKAAAPDYQAAVPASPPAGNIRAYCYNAADLATVHGRMLQGELSVAYLQCQNPGGSRAFESQYAAFVAKFNGDLSANYRALTQVARTKRLNVDVFVTEISNRTAQRAPVDREFCSRSKRALDWALDPKVTSLAQVPPPFDLGPEMNIFACPAP